MDLIGVNGLDPQRQHVNICLTNSDHIAGGHVFKR
jgi:hypothetical protein